MHARGVVDDGGGTVVKQGKTNQAPNSQRAACVCEQLLLPVGKSNHVFIYALSNAGVMH